jgi:hypothetical protein
VTAQGEQDGAAVATKAAVRTGHRSPNREPTLDDGSRFWDRRFRGRQAGGRRQEAGGRKPTVEPLALLPAACCLPACCLSTGSARA